MKKMLIHQPVSNPLVSIIMATYKCAQFLPDAICSVIAQTYPHWELHIVDDGSPDDTAEVVRRYLDDSRVHYYQQPNQGQASAKNRGLRAARGEFVAFLDGDDMWSHDKLEQQLPAFEGRPHVGLVHTDAMYITQHGEPIRRVQRHSPQGRISGELLIKNCVNGMASILRRECIERVGMFDESRTMSIDYDLWLRISAHYDIVYLDIVTYYYRQWPGQMSHRYEERMDNAIHIMNKFLREHPGLVPDEVVRTAWAHTYWSRGCSRFTVDRRWRDAFSDLLRAIRHQPKFLPAWKSLIKLALWRT